MELFAIIGIGAVVLFFAHRNSAPTAPTSTPAPPPPMAPAVPSPQTFSGAGSIVSGGYQTAPYNSAWGAAMAPASNALLDFLKGRGNRQPADPTASISGAVASSAAQLFSAISSPPVPAPPPAARGGIAGTIGTGGIPLGSNLRTGVTSGTGTTVVPNTFLQTLPLTKTLF